MSATTSAIQKSASLQVKLEVERRGRRETGWNSPGFDDSSWAGGPAEFGYGDLDEGTVISVAPAPRPKTAYFRTTVDVADPGAFASVLAEVVRDDGVAVYVNGLEVGRNNLPTGTLAFDTGAVVSLQTRAEELAPATFSIPSGAFQPGQNVIAVEVHNFDRWSGDMSFDLRLTGQL